MHNVGLRKNLSYATVTIRREQSSITRTIRGGPMRFIVALVISFALVWLCAKPLEDASRAFLRGSRRAPWSVFLGHHHGRAQRGLGVLPAAHAALRPGVSAVLHRDVRRRARRAQPAARAPHAHSPAAVHPRLHLRLRSHRLLRLLLRAAPGKRLYGQPRLLAGTRGAHHRAHGGAVGHLGPACEAHHEGGQLEARAAARLSLLRAHLCAPGPAAHAER